MANGKDGTPPLAARSRFWIDDLHVQPDRLMVVRGDEEIKLEKRLMQVLVKLAENSGKPVSADALRKEFWSDDDGNELYGENPVIQAIAVLRRKIGDNPRNPRYIETIPKIGFRMIAPVTWPEDHQRFTTSNG